MLPCSDPRGKTGDVYSILCAMGTVKCSPDRNVQILINVAKAEGCVRLGRKELRVSATLNVFVKDKLTGQPVSTARVIALTRNQIIDPPVRQVSGDGGANLYFQGPDFSPPVAVSLAVDAPGYAPYSTEDKPILFSTGVVNFEVFLDPFV
jgi:hypothetical protein